MHLAQAIILFLHHRQSSHVHTSPVISICSSWSHLNKDTCKHHSMLLPYFKSFTIFYILSGKCPNPSECRRSFVSGSAHVSRLLSSVFPVSRTIFQFLEEAHFLLAQAEFSTTHVTTAQLSHFDLLTYSTHPSFWPQLSPKGLSGYILISDHVRYL